MTFIFIYLIQCMLFYAAVCFLLSILAETDNKVLLVSYNINN